MHFYDSISDLLLDLHADLDDIGDELIWVYYDKHGQVIDYRYKTMPDEPTPKPHGDESIREMYASHLYKQLTK
ncbi:hypothetical protein [Enterococcus sp. CSURQ0835]|uniref:hypothetical protein n=1 Tax=Enterococcus sp. CSURQ0835 TaxID=2681394 RepID=UPI00135C40A7|nr:hypothetical protein [Enterococcus sp. CSURQ0835]